MNEALYSGGLVHSYFRKLGDASEFLPARSLKFTAVIDGEHFHAPGRCSNRRAETLALEDLLQVDDCLVCSGITSLEGISPKDIFRRLGPLHRVYTALSDPLTVENFAAQDAAVNRFEFDITAGLASSFDFGANWPRALVDFEREVQLKVEARTAELGAMANGTLKSFIVTRALEELYSMPEEWDYQASSVRTKLRAAHAQMIRSLATDQQQVLIPEDIHYQWSAVLPEVNRLFQGAPRVRSMVLLPAFIAQLLLSKLGYGASDRIRLTNALTAAFEPAESFETLETAAQLFYDAAGQEEMIDILETARALNA